MKLIRTFIRRNFLAGLLITVPFGLTVYVLFKLGKWIISILSALPSKLLVERLSQLDQFVFQFVAFAIGFAGTVLIVLIAGAAARNFIGRKLVGVSEDVISKIPFARTIYTSTKQIIETLFVGGFEGIKRVVVFEFPRKGIYSIGFVTGVVRDEASGKNLLGIFLPTAFNPTSGYYMLIPEDEATEIQLSAEDAFKVVVSGGLAFKLESIRPREENDK